MLSADRFRVVELGEDVPYHTDHAQYCDCHGVPYMVCRDQRLDGPWAILAHPSYTGVDENRPEDLALLTPGPCGYTAPVDPTYPGAAALQNEDPRYPMENGEEL